MHRTNAPLKTLAAHTRLLAAGLLLGLLPFACGTNKSTTDTPERTSRPGEYVGYSEAIYADDYAIRSQYVKMRDGVEIAVDVYRPKDIRTGEVTEEPLPVLWMHTPYNRRYNDPEQQQLTVEHYPGTAGKLVKYGYVVATADFRGLFASFGHNEGNNRGEWRSSAEYDAYDITEWLAAQPWSDGNIGMWGCSATGGSQMQAITQASPHLKAIFPMSFEYDVYDFRVPGGITGARGGVFPREPGDPTPQEARDARAVAVDGDPDSTRLRDAIAQHAGTVEGPGYLPFRDSYSTDFTDEVSKQWWVRSSPVTYLDRINASGIAMYMAVNWDEAHTKPGPFFAFNNFKTPNKLILGPGGHCDWNAAIELTGFDILVEERRFFDYWLKGIDNGIMDEAPVYYYTYNTPAGEEWRSAPSWPLPDEQRTPFYLGEESLAANGATGTGGTSETVVNYDPAASDGKLVYETAPLTGDVRVTGHPTMNLWVSSTATDGDFVATVKDVAPDGTTTSYNVQGQLRASLRKLAEPPFDYLGLPWHGYREADAVPLVPGEPTQLEFALLPISMVFPQGHRIRLEISFAGRGTPELTPAPRVSVYHGADHASYLTLPIIE